MPAACLQRRPQRLCREEGTLRLIFLSPPAGGKTLRGFFGTLSKADALRTKFLPRFLKKAGGAWGRAPAGPGRHPGGSGAEPRRKHPTSVTAPRKRGRPVPQSKSRHRNGRSRYTFFGSTGSPLSPVATAVAAAARVPSSSTDRKVRWST